MRKILLLVALVTSATVETKPKEFFLRKPYPDLSPKDMKDLINGMDTIDWAALDKVISNTTKYMMLIVAAVMGVFIHPTGASWWGCCGDSKDVIDPCNGCFRRRTITSDTASLAEGVDGMEMNGAVLGMFHESATVLPSTTNVATNNPDDEYVADIRESLQSIQDEMDDTEWVQADDEGRN